MRKILLLLPVIFLFQLQFSFAVPQQLVEAYCDEKQTFTERLFSKCKIPDNGICEDGETLLVDEDCIITKANISSGKIFESMWLLRFMILLSIFLLAINHKGVLLSTIIVGLLFLYNGAIVQAIPVPEPDIICNVTNLGQCFFGKYPILGWALVGLSIVFLFHIAKTKRQNP